MMQDDMLRLLLLLLAVSPCGGDEPHFSDDDGQLLLDGVQLSVWSQQQESKEVSVAGCEEMEARDSRFNCAISESNSGCSSISVFKEKYVPLK